MSGGQLIANSTCLRGPSIGIGNHLVALVDLISALLKLNSFHVVFICCSLVKFS